jgi:hypothetical protein
LYGKIEEAAERFEALKALFAAYKLDIPRFHMPLPVLSGDCE